jgi:hypothetical protein
MVLKIYSKKYGIRKVLIDEEDFDIIKMYKWHISKQIKTFYVQATISDKFKGETLKMHRLLMNAKKGQIIDHKNCNGLDNRRSNLRFCSFSENNFNHKRQKNNTSGYKGVCYRSKFEKWESVIHVNGKRLRLGYFKSPILAYEAYCEAAKKYHGKFARLI